MNRISLSATPILFAMSLDVLTDLECGYLWGDYIVHTTKYKTLCWTLKTRWNVEFIIVGFQLNTLGSFWGSIHMQAH